ncbi:hypothetical protein [Phytohabitans suffuscus]|uniref:Uncharacterized protein n=1 Tax=Phytohabitans suffuscus TaxID=624315 RepID=A0A6F8YW80_9ACTN|nr:hypothetical protein [Phytohabitans suffuscus]BCB90339.1 hypothetical protein Psuf_076520 [Phytohabitans suffuscus]
MTGKGSSPADTTGAASRHLKDDDLSGMWRDGQWRIGRDPFLTPEVVARTRRHLDAGLTRQADVRPEPSDRYRYEPSHITPAAVRRVEKALGMPVGLHVPIRGSGSGSGSGSPVTGLVLDGYRAWQASRQGEGAWSPEKHPLTREIVSAGLRDCGVRPCHPSLLTKHEVAAFEKKNGIRPGTHVLTEERMPAVLPGRSHIVYGMVVKKAAAQSAGSGGPQPGPPQAQAYVPSGAMRAAAWTPSGARLHLPYPPGQPPQAPQQPPQAPQHAAPQAFARGRQAPQQQR